jgi:AraC-like DNA-binding protein
LPNHLTLDAAEHHAGLACIGQMSADSGLSGPDAERHALLRHQLHALLLRLQLSHQRLEPAAASSASPRSLLRFQRFRDAVAADFTRVHQVRDYARRLGCSEKSLTRSTLELAGVSAKAFVSQRIALEARRLLAHTSLPVSVIAAQLGMDEANNFAKFFKREVGCTPTEFRRQQGE